MWPPVRSTGPTVYIATDASDDKWSWVEMTGGRVFRNPSGSFPASDGKPQGPHPDMSTPLRYNGAPHPNKDTPIYYKELFAVLVALRALDGTAAGMIVLTGDNTGVIGSIRKRVAPEGAWAMLDEIEDIIRRNGWGLDLRWVESDGNVAHSATHNEDPTEYRTERSWLLATSEEYPPPVGGLKREKKRER